MFIQIDAINHYHYWYYLLQGDLGSLAFTVFIHPKKSGL